MKESIVIQMSQQVDQQRELLKRKKLEAEKEAKKHRPGRPRKRKKKKTFKDRRQKNEFIETRVGYFLKLEAPLEYDLILQVSGNNDPHPDLIEMIGYGSMNPLFKKPKFRKALIEYRSVGCYAYRAKQIDPITELSYIKRRKMLNFL